MKTYSTKSHPNDSPKIRELLSSVSFNMRQARELEATIKSLQLVFKKRIEACEYSVSYIAHLRRLAK